MKKNETKIIKNKSIIARLPETVYNETRDYIKKHGFNMSEYLRFLLMIGRTSKIFEEEYGLDRVKQELNGTPYDQLKHYDNYLQGFLYSVDVELNFLKKVKTKILKTIELNNQAIQEYEETVSKREKDDMEKVKTKINEMDSLLTKIK
ncbi:MAG: hypothetical protein ACFFG0_53180 [Candidatus Thorarchaeota archaeon]